MIRMCVESSFGMVLRPKAPKRSARGNASQVRSEATKLMRRALLRRGLRAYSTTDVRAALFDLSSPAPLLHDPYLPLVAKPAELGEPTEFLTTVADVIGVRTRAIDSWLEKPSWPPVRTTKRQIVLLNAGLDTRAYRLGLGQSMTLFEVEHDEALIALKRSTLSAAGHEPRNVVVDVTASPSVPEDCAKALLKAGFNPEIPTRWVAQGPLLQGQANVAELFAMAGVNGGTPASGLAAQVLEPSWAAELKELGFTMEGAEHLMSIDEALDAAKAAGWREKRTLRQADFANDFVRSPSAAFALIFADADSDP